MDVTITPSFREDERAQVAQMYWGAFGHKLGRIMGPEARGTAFVHAALDPSHALCARATDGQLLGVLGFKTYHSALVHGTWPLMVQHFGPIGAAWRAAAMALLEQDVENRRFLIDGIFVDASHRGHGVGAALLRAVAKEARARGYDEVRLDVIDTNPRARALYERMGFTALPDQKLGVLRPIFGFNHATPMTRSTFGL